MNPNDEAQFELDNGKVFSKEQETEMHLAAFGLWPIIGYHDFLRNVPHSHSDN